MLRKPDEIDQAIMAPARIVPLDRARTFIVLLVLLHHSVINYTYFGRGDPMRWLGFDLVVLFNDSFFMAFMFFISGLFVRDSLVRKGWAIFLRDRAWRLGVPFLISIFVLMPIAYYPTFLLYPAYFFAGVGVGAVSLKLGLLAEDGELARRWPVWLAFASAFYLAILILVYAHHNWVADFDTPPLPWRTSYGLAFATYSAAMAFTVLAIFLRFTGSGSRLLDAMRASAYGIYLLHYIFIVWLQYAIYDFSFPAVIKFAIVFAGTLSLSWGLTSMLRKIPGVARMI